MPGGFNRLRKMVSKAGYISRDRNESVEVDMDGPSIEFNYRPVCMMLKDGLKEPMADTYTAFAMTEAIIR